MHMCERMYINKEIKEKRDKYLRFEIIFYLSTFTKHPLFALYCYYYIYFLLI